MSTSGLGRRRFLGLAALGAFGVATGRLVARQLPAVGLQMRSVAEAVGNDLPGTLERIAAIGYKEVEFWTQDGLAFDAVAARRALDRVSLAAASLEVRMSDLFANWRVVLERCQALGNRSVVCEEIPAPERTTLDGYARIAELLNAAGKIMQWAGVRLALRQHEYDFIPLDGIVPFDYLMDATDPVLVKVQMDLSVLAKVNRDPSGDLVRYPDRFVSVYLHDVDGSPQWRPVGLGEGRINLAAILPDADHAGIQHYFVVDQRLELPWDHAAANFAYLSHLDFK